MLPQPPARSGSTFFEASLRGRGLGSSPGIALALALALVACGGSPEPAAAPEAAPPPATEPAPTEPRATTADDLVAERIAQFDVAAKNGTATAEAQAFIREHEGELTRLYVDDYAELSPKARLALINLLVSFQSEATVPAHAAAIGRYADGEGNVDEAIWACQAAKKLSSPRLADALMKAFDHIDMGGADGQRFGRHLADAMEHNLSPSWKPKLEQHRDAKIDAPISYEDAAAVRTYRNQRYWQETSVRLLARLEAGGAG